MSCRSCIMSILFIILAAVAGPAIAQEESVLSVEVVGTAQVSADETEMKEEALHDAFKKAVVLSVERLIPKDILLHDAGYIEWRIYNKASKYIQNYRITSEAKKVDLTTGESVYRLPVKADVTLSLLKEDLLKLGILLKKEGMRFKVLLRVNDLLDYGEFESLEEKLREIDIVKDVSYVSFYKGRILLLLDVTKGAQQLRERLSGDISNSFEVAMVGHNMIVLRKR